MKRFKTAVRILLFLIIGMTLGLRFYAWNAKSLTGNAVPMPFGVGASVVLSGSMEPSLSVGDLIVFKEEDSYKQNDTVVYQSGRTSVVHRIIELKDEMVITKGDANNTADEPFRTNLIRGKVVAVFPAVGYLILALKSPVGTWLTIVTAVLLMELSYRKERKQKKQEQEQIKAEIRKLMQELEEQRESGQ